MTEYIPIEYLNNYVSDYKECNSCLNEEEFTGKMPHFKEYKGYGVEHCCKFPVKELTSEIWDKAINDYEN